jgi:hypothetical protein
VNLLELEGRMDLIVALLVAGLAAVSLLWLAFLDKA